MINEAQRHSLLTGDESVEKDQKTEAQLNDERQPEALSESSNLFLAAEEDETPAIERTISHRGVIAENHNDKPVFDISSDFEKEIKQREAAERKKREKKRAEEERKAKAAADEHKKAIMEQINNAHTLDPDEIRELLDEEHRKANTNKIYPDAKPIINEYDQAIWEKNQAEGSKIPGRGRADGFINEQLASSIKSSVLCQIISVLLFLAAYFLPYLKGIPISNIVVYFGAILAAIASIIQIYTAANKTRHKSIPQNQKNTFVAATIFPGLAIRLGLVVVFQMILAAVPSISTIGGTFIGSVVGASLHYTFLNNHDVGVSGRLSLANSALFIIAYSFIVMPDIVSSMSAGDPSGAAGSLGSAFSAGLAIVIFCISDRIAMIAAPNSTS